MPRRSWFPRWRFGRRDLLAEGELGEQTGEHDDLAADLSLTPDSDSLSRRVVPSLDRNHNAVCERFQGTALQECWRPAFHRRRFDRLTQLRAEIDSWLVAYNSRRPNRSDFMRGRTPRQVLDTHHNKKAA